MNYYTRSTKFGNITLVEDRGFLVSLIFGDISDGIKSKKVKFSKFLKNFMSETIEAAFLELDEYFAGKRKEFDVPMNPSGTSFQQKVWSSLISVPYGRVASYKDIAERIGNSKAGRAVGMANNKNKIPIFIPCHRIVSADGSMGGYADGVEIKQKLLELEKQFS